jgi:Rps23 Pro-64 3,4-dihydroxylase Tpa1-like proline 4-hydroxylase
MDACVIPKVFTKEQCESIISFHIDWIENEGYVGDNEDRRIDTSKRRCIVYEPPSEEHVPSWLIGKIFKIIFAVNKKVFNFDLGKGNVEGKRPQIELNLLKYDPGGQYDTHIDLGQWPPSSLRKISFTLLLNDSYGGGKLRVDILPELSENYPEIGDMIIFPSYLTHRVEPVTAGVRWALVGWIISDNPFR